MSTLLCGKEGIITIESPGKIYIEPQTVNEESGDIEAIYKFKYNWTKESLPSSEWITPEFLEKVVEIARKVSKSHLRL